MVLPLVAARVAAGVAARRAASAAAGRSVATRTAGNAAKSATGAVAATEGNSIAAIRGSMLDAQEVLARSRSQSGSTGTITVNMANPVQQPSASTSQRRDEWDTVYRDSGQSSSAKTENRTQIKEQEAQTDLIREEKRNLREQSNQRRQEFTMQERLARKTEQLSKYDLNARTWGWIGTVIDFIGQVFKTFIFSPLKLFFTVFIIFAIATSIILGILVVSADKCKDDIKITEGASPLTNLYRQLLNPAFLRCAFWDNIMSAWKPIQKLDMTNRVMNFMDQQIMSATGQYYFTRVDKNSEEKIGIFIDKLQLQESGYDMNLPTLIYATLKAVGGDFKGIHYCSLRGKTGTRIPNQEFKLTENVGEEIGCSFPAGEITEPGRDYEFRFVVLSDVSTYAYSNPFFIKRSTYDIIKKDQKELEMIKERAGELLLKTTNAPMEIAGRIGTEGQNLVIVDDSGDSTQNVNKLEISFRKDWTTDDLAVIKKINKFAIVLPAGIEIDQNGPGAYSGSYCGSFAFKKANCNELAAYFDKEYDKRICRDGDNAYTYDPGGKGEKLENINQEKKIQCQIGYKRLDLLFKDGGIDSSMKMSNIQTMATYSFEITRIARIRYDAKIPIQTELLKYTCEDSTVALQQPVVGDISNETKKEYRKYQDTVKQFVSSDIPSGLSQEMFEAMMAAVMQRFTQEYNLAATDLTKDGRIDYVTGCRLPLEEPLRAALAEDYYEDIKCLAGSLASKYIVSAGDIDKTLSLYYDDSEGRKTVYQGKRSTKNDAVIWTKALCYPTSAVTETPIS